MSRIINLIVVTFDCSYSQLHIAGCHLQPKAKDIINLAACVFECVFIWGVLAGENRRDFGLRLQCWQEIASAHQMRC